MKNLMEEVKFEPQVALDGGCNGLKAYKNIFSQIKSVLSKNGSILFEIDIIMFIRFFGCTENMIHEILNMGKNFYQ